MFQSNLLKLSGLLFSSSLALASLSSAAQAENAPWTGFDTKQGSASFETSANKTNITSHQNRYYGVSSNLDIPEHYHVNIDQISKSSLFAAKAAADADPTKILGKLTSNGRLLVIDQNGFFFGQNSIVDASGFMAVAGEI